MLSNPVIRCPECSSARFRESRWHSRVEKARYPGMRPYRCTECSHRFLAIDHQGIAARRLLVGLGMIFAVLVFGIAFTLFHAPAGLVDDDIRAVAVSLVPQSMLQAAEEGDSDAQFRVGKNLFFEAAIDGEKAAAGLKWLQQAADNGNTGAMIQLGRMYWSGVGALQNYELAAQWMEKAARRGDPEGMLELGRFYRDGIGFETDLILAYVWFNRAAAVLNMDAARERDSISFRLNAEELKTAQSLSHHNLESQ